MKKVLVDNKAVSQSQTVVKFGLNQISSTTPPLATKIFRAILYIAAVGNLVIDIFPEIPFEIKAHIAMYSIKSVALVHGITKLFGLEVKDPGK